MSRFLSAVIFLYLVSAPCFGQSSLVGTYKVVSFTTEVDDQPPIENLGKAPRGYLVLTPTRWIHVITGENRKFGASIEAKAALWESLSAYSGPYRLEGDRLIVTVDVSWNESWNATQVIRNWQVEGNRLAITTARAPYARDPSKMAVTRVVWEKVE
jgi:hypothetical protein